MNQLHRIHILLQARSIVGLPITFSTVSGDTLPGVTYSWDFGDGTPISNDRDPIHSYATGGTYFPLLTVTNPGGCSITYSLQIDVYNCALAAMSVSNACINRFATITFTGVSLPSANYTWNFTGATVLSGSGAGPYTVQWNSPGTYAVDLTIIRFYRMFCIKCITKCYDL